MEKMTNPTEEHASTIEAFRVFDGEGRGYISTQVLRDVILKSLDQVPPFELEDLLGVSGLAQDKNISYEGNKKTLKRYLFNKFTIYQDPKDYKTRSVQ